MTTLSARLWKQDTARTSGLLVCLVGLLWALMETLTQLLATEYSLYQVIWVRYATHLLFLLAVFGPRMGLRLAATTRPGAQVARGLMMLVMPVSFLLAAQHDSAASILAVFWLAPFAIIGLSAVWLKEHGTWRAWALALVGFACVLVLLRPSASLSPGGALLSLAMCLSFSLYIVMTRLLRDEGTPTNLFYTAACVLVPLSLYVPSVWKPVNLHSGLLMAVIGLLGFDLLWVLDKAVELKSAAMTAPFLFSEMFFFVVLKLLARIF